MSAVNINRVIVLALLGLVAMSFQFFETLSIEKTKTIEKTFGMDADDYLEVHNKYGGVNIQTWDRQEVKFVINIIVKAATEKRVDEMMELIKIDFSESSNRVSAETNIESSGFWGWGNNTKYEINYEILMPQNAYIKMSNKYGNTNIASMLRDIDADIKYGNIDLEAQQVDVDLDLKYGNGNLKSAKELDAEIKYSNFTCGVVKRIELESGYSQIDIRESDVLICESKYSGIKVGRVVDLVNEGKYDDIEIQQVGNITINSGYTDVLIEKLFQSLNIEHRYGDLDVREVDSGVTKIDIDVKYTDVTINTSNVGYTLDLNGAYLDFSLDSGFNQSSKDKDGSSISIEGVSGSGKIALDCRMQYGDLKVR